MSINWPQIIDDCRSYLEISRGEEFSEGDPVPETELIAQATENGHDRTVAINSLRETDDVIRTTKDGTTGFVLADNIQEASDAGGEACKSRDAESSSSGEDTGEEPLPVPATADPEEQSTDSAPEDEDEDNNSPTTDGMDSPVDGAIQATADREPDPIESLLEESTSDGLAGPGTSTGGEPAGDRTEKSAEAKSPWPEPDTADLSIDDYVTLECPDDLSGLDTMAELTPASSTEPSREMDHPESVADLAKRKVEASGESTSDNLEQLHSPMSSDEDGRTDIHDERDRFASASGATAADGEMPGEAKSVDDEPDTDEADTGKSLVRSILEGYLTRFQPIKSFLTSLCIYLLGIASIVGSGVITLFVWAVPISTGVIILYYFYLVALSGSPPTIVDHVVLGSFIIAGLTVLIVAGKWDES